jgi:hypothetical protein
LKTRFAIYRARGRVKPKKREQQMARQFTRPAPGNQYSKAQRDEWGAAQDAARAARAAQPAPTPAKRPSRANNKPLIADVGDSECFNSLVWEDGTVTAQFAKDGSVYEYDMSRKEAATWFDDDLGSYFNSEIR